MFPLAALPFVFVALASVCDARVTVGRIFSDRMVLQDHATYDQRPMIYGQADVHELVTVTRQQPDGANDTIQALTDATGAWIVQVRAAFVRGMRVYFRVMRVYFRVMRVVIMILSLFSSSPSFAV